MTSSFTRGPGGPQLESARGGEDDPIARDKRALRAELLAWRAALPPATHARLSSRAARHLARLPAFRAARTVGLYAPVRGEVDTSALFELARAGEKRVVFPRVEGVDSSRALRFRVVQDLGELERGSFGVLEPRGGAAAVPIEGIDLLVIPGVGFDREGLRLGYGGGFYDRLLAGHAQPGDTVGLAFEGQLRDTLPRASHDRRVSWVVTEDRCLSTVPSISGARSARRIAHGG